MKTMFDIRPSEKFGIQSNEQFIVTNDDIIYLRVIRQNNIYFVLTATADENDGILRSYKDIIRLKEVALKTRLRLARKLNLKAVELTREYDRSGREYVTVCTCPYISDAHRVAEEFFDVFKEEIDNDPSVEAV